jgi:D-3-phosphoglycerate dehydrogenase
MATILVTTRGVDVTENGPLADLLRGGHEIRYTPMNGQTPTADVIRNLQGVPAVIAGGEHYTDEVFVGAPDLRHVARFGVGYDAIDVDAATRHGVVVTNCPGSNATAVADLTLGLMISIARGIPGHDRNVRAGTWQSSVGGDVWQRTLGIVGLGRIGQGVARRARGFDMRILAYEPFPNDDFVREYKIEMVPLERVFSESDFVTLHLPASAETEGLVDQRLFALMKPTAYFINAARGTLVDEDALYEALVNKRIAGAALDVRAGEPPKDTRFNELDNVVLTPHTAAGTVQARVNGGKMAAEAVVKVLAGQQPVGLVNPEVWEKRRPTEALRAR